MIRQKDGEEKYRGGGYSTARGSRASAYRLLESTD